MMKPSPPALYGEPASRAVESDEAAQNERKSFIAIGEKILSKIGDIEQQLTPQKEIMNSREACDFLKVKPQQLYTIRKKFNIPSMRPTGKKLYFKRSDLLSWLETHRIELCASNV